MIMRPTQTIKRHSQWVSPTIGVHSDPDLVPSIIALVLCERFGQAKEMFNKASTYYTQFTATISTGALKKWTKEITLAESW